MGKYGRGVCSVCRHRCSLYADGTVWRHDDVREARRGVRCAGAGRKPTGEDPSPVVLPVPLERGQGT